MYLTFDTQKQNNTTYQHKLADYERKLEQFKEQHAVKSDTVTSSELNQQLKSATQSDAVITVSNLNGMTEDTAYEASHSSGDNYDQTGAGAKSFIIPTGEGSLTATYSNLKNWSYEGKSITKIVYQIQTHKNMLSNVAQNQYDNSRNPSWNYFALTLSKDPTRGFSYYGISVDVTMTMYYADGTPVNFEPDTAFFAVGSLNNYTNILNSSSIETTKVNSGGKALGLYGSSVTVHTGNVLYSTNPNTVYDNSTTTDTFNPNAHYTPNDGPKDWDINGSGKQYFGAGLIDLSGTSTSFTAQTILPNADKSMSYRNWAWWNATTVIPKTPGFQETPPTPKYSSINYHYDTS